MINKIWNWLVPSDGINCEIKSRSYIIIYDGNMGFVVPVDTERDGGRKEHLFASRATGIQTNPDLVTVK
jgi:hypothetical protein